MKIIHNLLDLKINLYKNGLPNMRSPVTQIVCKDFVW